MTSPGTFLRVAALAACAAVLVVPASGQDAELIAEQASGLVPLQGESGVLIRGIRGHIVVRSASVDGIHFKSTDQITKGEVPIRVIAEGGRLVFEPLDGRDDRKRLLELFVAHRLGCVIEASDSEVQLDPISSGAEVRGTNLVVYAANVSGSLALDLAGGSFNLNHNSGDVIVRGKSWKGSVESSDGRLGVYGGPGTLEVQELANRFDADLEGVRVRAVGIEGELQLRLRNGEAQISEAHAGGELRLDGAALSLSRTGGRFEVYTDSAVQFSALAGALYVEGDAAAVKGIGSSELVEVRNHDAEVSLEKIDADVRLEGAGLKVRLTDIAGRVEAVTRSSTLEMTSVLGDVVIENDGGDVRLASVSGNTEVKATGGIVRVLGQIGAVSLDVESPEMTVEWTILPPGEDSRIENRNGPVTVRLPTSGNGCRIEARSRFGRVEAPFKRVVLSADKAGAQGWVGSDTKGIVRIDAEGDVVISGGPPDREEASEEP